MTKRYLQLITTGLIILLVSACFSGGYAPVYSTGESVQGKIKYYTVRRGDTLYSIAFKYGLDYKELAAANGIGKPYLININQKLRLVGTAKRVMVGENSKTNKPAIMKPRGVSTAKNVQQSTVAPVSSDIKWHWPADGAIVKPYSLVGDINKGIDISGKRGEAVKSAADGVIVYAAGGLRGYGKLVIVKHNDQFLSAYGHNRKILVTEGQQVRAGQKLAEFGSADTDQAKLHFEIRHKGKPVNPMSYLPKR